MFSLKPILAIKPQFLGLFMCAAIPLLTYAAVKDSQAVEPENVDAGITAVKASENHNDDQKNLANEPSSRGKLLYENHCLSCHESMVHIRGAHKAKTIEDVQYWVGRWAVELNVKWSADEIDDVVQHLNQTFYHY
jgi:hypothetical protein